MKKDFDVRYSLGIKTQRRGDLGGGEVDSLNFKTPIGGQRKKVPLCGQGRRKSSERQEKLKGLP